jgi:hypothetical protein
MGCGSWYLETPPPCPVDDTPYTACTPESVARRLAQQLAAQGQTLPAGTLVVVPVERPPSLPPATPGPVPQPMVVETFTTKTYRGKHPKPPRTLPPHSHSHR